MTGKDIDYEEILRQCKTTPEQAADDLERLILRGETPAPGSLALAVKLLRESGREKTGAEMFEDLGYPERKTPLVGLRVFQNSGGIIQVGVITTMGYFWGGKGFLHGEVRDLSPEEKKAAEKVREEMRAAK